LIQDYIVPLPWTPKLEVKLGQSQFGEIPLLMSKKQYMGKDMSSEELQQLMKTKGSYLAEVLLLALITHDKDCHRGNMLSTQFGTATRIDFEMSGIIDLKLLEKFDMDKLNFHEIVSTKDNIHIESNELRSDFYKACIKLFIYPNDKFSDEKDLLNLQTVLQETSPKSWGRMDYVSDLQRYSIDPLKSVIEVLKEKALKSDNFRSYLLSEIKKNPDFVDQVIAELYLCEDGKAFNRLKDNHQEMKNAFYDMAIKSMIMEIPMSDLTQSRAIQSACQDIDLKKINGNSLGAVDNSHLIN